jgi:hypothetical protein
MELGTCKLCQQEKLLAKSHIFPESLYEQTYDEKHRFVSVTTHPNHKPKLIQQGFWEYLLCLECEAKINNYEDYSVSLLKDADKYRTPDNKAILIPNFDYLRFKLFGLSLIWRSHLSKHHIFKPVKLGPHAEKMRSMLFSGTPGKPFEYCFTLLRIEGPEIAKTIMHGPTTAKFYGHRAYVFLAYGFEWTFVVSNHSDYLTDQYPFVGVLPELVILIERKSKGQFLHDIGLKMRTLIDKARQSPPL